MYRYYDIHGRECVCNYTGNTSLVGLIITLTILSAFVIIGALSWICAYVKVKPVGHVHANSNDIYIVDNVGLADNERELRNALEEFLENTGIPVTVYISDDDWKKHYNSMETYAYELYVKSFTDESHWLLVYSESVMDDGFVDFDWHGMQGDDTVDILTNSYLNKFNDTVHDELLRGESFYNALVSGFNRFPSNIASKWHWGAVVIPLIYGGIFLFTGLKEQVKAVRSYASNKRCKKWMEENGVNPINLNNDNGDHVMYLNGKPYDVTTGRYL